VTHTEGQSAIQSVQFQHSPQLVGFYVQNAVGPVDVGSWLAWFALVAAEMIEGIISGAKGLQAGRPLGKCGQCKQDTLRSGLTGTSLIPGALLPNLSREWQS
jgi:hypothetical protein